MPRSTYRATEFLIELPNLTKGSSDVKRKAIVRFLDTNWESRYVRIAVRTIFYAKNADNSYGEEIKSMGRPEVYITAANQCVNEATGELLVNPDGTFMTEDQIPEEITYNHEFDWFDMIAGTPQNVKGMITQYVITSFESGKYDV